MGFSRFERPKKPVKVYFAGVSADNQLRSRATFGIVMERRYFGATAEECGYIRGTQLFADFAACAACIQLLSDWPWQRVILFTSSPPVADFLTGKTPISSRRELQRLQRSIARLVEGRLALGPSGSRPFLHLERRADSRRPNGVQIAGVELVAPERNRRALRVARIALAHWDEQPPF
jgi:hypothetical protein